MLRILLVTVTLAVTNTLASVDFSYGNAPLYPLQPKLISQTVHLNEIPTKVIKITKTVAVKVPVPYPVKIPHHIPIAVPVKHPIAVPVPHFIKVAHHVPIEVDRPILVNLPQQRPIFIPKTIEVPQPVPVPHAVHVPKPIYFEPLPYAARHGDEHAHDTSEDLYARASGYGADQGSAQEENVSEYEQYAASQNHDRHFRPSPRDYTSEHRY